MGYQIRFDSSAAPATQLLFVTEGVLLRQLQGDPLLGRYGVVIVDEVHERHMGCDILLGVLKCIIATRPSLRVILMSATINTEMFSGYFDGPVLSVPGRSYPVEVEYIPTRDDDELELARERTGAATPGAAPAAAAAAAVAGMDEARVRALRRLAVEEGLQRDHYVNQEARRIAGGGAAAAGGGDGGGGGGGGAGPPVGVEGAADERTAVEQLAGAAGAPIRRRSRIDSKPYVSIISRIDETVPKEERGDVLIFVCGTAEIGVLCDRLADYARGAKRWIVLPLHAGLSAEEQDRVFAQPPAGVRKCIVATNIAETAVTIDGIR